LYLEEKGFLVAGHSQFRTINKNCEGKSLGTIIKAGTTRFIQDVEEI
jgi:hypothetical protein